MQIGIVLATVMVGLLSTLAPESSYVYEAIIMVFLGAGLGVVMPVMNLAVQNEFKQRDLGAATSSSQLFRSLGSTVGVAIFGAMLTAGVTSSLGNISQDAYVQSLAKSPAVQQIGNLNDSNTLLNLNMPSTRQKITDGFNKSVASLPVAIKETVTKQFTDNQAAYSNKVTHAFSDSLQRIFLTSTGLMAAAAVLVFSLKDKQLQSASPQETPGEV